MIQFTLKCDNDHRFDSWFQSADAYDKLHRAGLVACAVCGSETVEKAIMAPRVLPSRSVAAPAASPPMAPPAPAAPAAAPATTGPKGRAGPLTTPASPAETALSELRKHVEANSEYVGMEFVNEARAMHDGDAPARPIHGEAGVDEAKKLLEDGVPVAPLPFRPTRKTN